MRIVKASTAIWIGMMRVSHPHQISLESVQLVVIRLHYSLPRATQVAPPPAFPWEMHRHSPRDCLAPCPQAPRLPRIEARRRSPSR